MGLQPLLSDRLTSEFNVLPDKNSIETCLANVRKCDVFIIILSQRYGPSLKSVDYPDISATHLEYREAKSNNKPILYYVRDRLEADYSIYNKNNESDLPWVQKKDYGIFDLIREHTNINKNNNCSNWFWTFRNSLELKNRLKKDLQSEAGESILRGLIEAGRIAYIIPHIEKWSITPKNKSLNLSITLDNCGTAAAIQPGVSIYWVKNENHVFIKSLMPGQSETLEIELPLTHSSYRERYTTVWLEIGYSTPEGHYVSDDASVDFYWAARPKTFARPLCEYNGKKYCHSNGIQITTYKRNE